MKLVKIKQKQSVIKRAKRYGRVTRDWALSLNITRLAAIIKRLEKEGYQFPMEDRGYTNNRDYKYVLTKAPKK